MDEPERWRRVRQILNGALDLSLEERHRYLDERCGEDGSLRRTVSSLLRACADAESLLGTDSDTASQPPDAPLEQGEHVGPYVIHERVGEGGFGDVYLAERRDDFRKQVAVKMLKPGMDSREVLARFGAEKQALALMHHANVAGILDAGTSSAGRPYFVTAYIPGKPITRYCDERRLGVDERLGLFLQICDGVLHAHQKGIIHRDLKPSNILVSDVEGPPTPVIIDFGVAKALDRPLTSETVFTHFGRLVGTPVYMSPEQWRGRPGDVDTRSDIYALGVLLYELLVGHLPFRFDHGQYEEIRQIVLDVDPPRPSTRLIGLGSREALRAAEQRSCGEVATLVRRVRGDLDWIVMKCLDKDRARRYGTAAELAADIRRHLANVPVLAHAPSAGYRLGKFFRRHGLRAVVVSIVAAIVLAASVFGVLLRRAEATNASHRGAELLQIARRIDGLYPRRAQVHLEEARQLAPKLADEIDAEIAYVLLRLGRPRDAVTLAEEVLRRNPVNGPAMAILAGLLRKDDPKRSSALETEARRLLTRDRAYYLALGIEDDAEAVTRLSEGLEKYPWGLDALWQRAARLYSLHRDAEALADAELLLKVGDDLGMVWNLRGAVELDSASRLGEAEAARREELIRESIGDFSEAIRVDPGLAVAYSNRGMAHMRRRAYDEALADVLQGIRLDPEDREARKQKCEILFEARRNEEALQACTDCIEGGATGFESYRVRGETYYRLDRHAEAIADLTIAIDHAQQAGAGASPRRLAELYDRRGMAHRNTREYEAAQHDAERALEYLPEFPRGESNLGWALLFERRFSEARAHFERAVSLEPHRATRILGRGVAAWSSNDGKDAIDDFRDSCKAPGFEPVCLWAWEIATERGDLETAARLLALTRERAEAATPERRHFVEALVDVAEAGPERVAAAEQGARDAASKDSERLEASYVFGCVAASRGRNEDAEAHFKSCSESPNPDWFERDLARLRRTLGR